MFTRTASACKQLTELVPKPQAFGFLDMLADIVLNSTVYIVEA